LVRSVRWIPSGAPTTVVIPPAESSWKKRRLVPGGVNWLEN